MPSNSEALRGVQRWMALDLHMALGRPIDMRSTTGNQGHDSWADWWADLCADVRRNRTGDPSFVPYLMDEQGQARIEPAISSAVDVVASVIAEELLNNLNVDLPPVHAELIASKVLTAVRAAGGKL